MTPEHPLEEPEQQPAPLIWRLSRACVAFSAASNGDMRDLEARTRWLATLGLDRLARVPQQVHGVQIIEVSGTSPTTSPCDGLVSADPLVVLGALGADCPGLCIDAGDILGVAHCGWRGIAGGIPAGLVRSVRRLSRHPLGTWEAFVGPGIGAEDYEVDGPVIEARTWPAGTLIPTSEGRARLDLVATIIADLNSLGVRLVRSSGVSTRRDPRLRSYRRSGAGLVQMLAIWRDRTALGS